MKTTIGRLQESLTTEEMKDFVEFGGCQSKAFGNVEILRRYSDGSVEITANLFLGAALSLGFRPEFVDTYGSGEKGGSIWRVSEDTLYVLDNGDGSWWQTEGVFNRPQLSIVKKFLEAKEEEVQELQELLDELEIGYS